MTYKTLDNVKLSSFHIIAKTCFPLCRLLPSLRREYLEPDHLRPDVARDCPT